jgi:hypothetical protein
MLCRAPTYKNTLTASLSNQPNDLRLALPLLSRSRNASEHRSHHLYDMFKFKKEKGGYGSHPPTPKIQSVSLPEMGGGEVLSPKRPITPWPASPRPVIPRTTTPHPSIFRTATPVPPSAPLKPCLKTRKRTMTITGDTSEAARAASKLREEYVPPSKVSPTTRERKLSTTGGGSSMAKPKKVLPPVSCTYGWSTFLCSPLRTADI